MARAEAQSQETVPSRADSGGHSAGQALGWELACPVCRHPLGSVGGASPIPEPLRCEGCSRTFTCSAGIWRFLPDERARRYDTFLREYQIVRADEGWGASQSGYYRSLPRTGRDDPQAAIWRIRARSFGALLSRVLAPCEAQWGRPLKILDLGAGNCWLSHRLAQRGHQAVAVDVSADPQDGLGAHVHYKPTENVLPVQAEFDRLPFAGGQAHLVVFNASLHYSPDCAVTLAEAVRVLRPDGCLAVMDSPVYRDGNSGAQMVQERETAFLRKYGFRSNTLPAENFFTTRRLAELAAETGIRWQVVVPFNGVGWLLRPWKARLRRRREPARLPLIIGRLTAGNGDAHTG